MSIMKEWERQRAAERRAASEPSIEQPALPESDSAEAVLGISYSMSAGTASESAVAGSQDDWLEEWMELIRGAAELRYLDPKWASFNITGLRDGLFLSYREGASYVLYALDGDGYYIRRVLYGRDLEA